MSGMLGILSTGEEEGGVVRGKDRRVFSQNGGDDRVSLELPVQEVPDLFSVPAFRVFEIRIER